MDKMKVKILSESSIEQLERSIEWYLNKYQENNNTILDIKFGGCGGLHNHGYGGFYEYSAMIIYQ